MFSKKIEIMQHFLNKNISFSRSIDIVLQYERRNLTQNIISARNAKCASVGSIEDNKNVNI